MKTFLCMLLFISIPIEVLCDGDEWVSLFDGKSLDGWKAPENPGSFTVEDGKIKAHGSRSHLYYIGPVKNHDFKNFEFKAEVMTRPLSNSGIYFHTQLQKKGWPKQGYEVQINNSQPFKKRKTGSLYKVKDIHKTPVKDNEWFTLYIAVRGKHIMVKINGKTVVDYTEPKPPAPPKEYPKRILSSGTFALQSHDFFSTVYFKDMMVKPLPDRLP